MLIALHHFYFPQWKCVRGEILKITANLPWYLLSVGAVSWRINWSRWQVAKTWIICFRQFGAVLNLFLDKPLRVDMGYNSRELVNMSEDVANILNLMHQHGGISALMTIRRSVPAFQPEVDGTEAMGRRRGPLSIRRYTLMWKQENMCVATQTSS